MTTPYAEAPATRPTLLTIICILSSLLWIWSLWSSVQSAFTDKPQRDLEESKIQMEKTLANVEGQGPAAEAIARFGESAIEMAENHVRHKAPLGYMGIAFALVSLAGVWFMWNLKKSGFWLYILATVVSLFAPLYYLGTGSAAIAGVTVFAILGIIFIILYAVNLKHMR